MNTEDFDIFLAINRCKNISRAANVLFMSQSTLSYKLSVLETEIGAKLFNRQKGHASLDLTEAGKRFLVIAEKMRVLSEEALHVGDLHSRTKVLVAGVDSVNGYFLIDFYRQFVKENPDIELSVINGYSDDILNKVEQRVYDVGISNAYYDFESVRSEILFKEEYVCLKRCAQEKRALSDATITPQELNPEAEVYQGFDFNLIQWHKIVFPNLTPKFTTEIVRMSANLMDSEGDWCIMPYSVARYYSKKPEFQIFKLESPPPPRIVYVTTNIKSNDYNSNHILIFKEELLSYVKKHFIQDMIYV